MRAKILLAFALLGFLAGIVAFYSYAVAVPWIQQVLPDIIWAPWFISGIAGAVITLIILVVWAYAMNKD
jgi:hypothetical protein